MSQDIADARTHELWVRAFVMCGLVRVVDDGERPRLSTSDRARLVELEREVRELRRADASLKTASAFFAAELDRPSPR
jgi:transposase-like protein